jgi:iron complex outermembrane receptor protein
MDNYSLRAQPGMGPRHNQANAENLAWSVDAQLPLTTSELKLGLDGNNQSHNSVVTNPEAHHFKIDNFVDSERDSLGVFAELSGNHEKWNYQLGFRHNRIELNSDEVDAMMGHMHMGDMHDAMSAMHTKPCDGMQSCATQLSDAFNQSDRSINFNTNNLVIKLNSALNKDTTLSIDLGVKQRAPSYRETFLWLPMSITGGLADGRNYVGNLALKPETSREINLGLSKNKDNFSIQPQVFYRQIDNYIQGVPSNNSIANQFSQDMSNMHHDMNHMIHNDKNNVLIYSNTSAEIYGLDANWNLSINNQWSANGMVSYVRGKRTDIKDNLYRIAPTNALFSVNYQASQAPLRVSVESIIYARQKHVASYAGESQTAGYGVINLTAQWTLNNQLQVRSGITNIFDRCYANHLSSVNRNSGSDIAEGEVIPGMGRTFYLQTRVQF